MVTVELGTLGLALPVWCFAMLSLRSLQPGKATSSYVAYGFFSLIMVFLSIVAHELGHYLVGILQGRQFVASTFSLFGARVGFLSDEVSYAQQIVFFVCGPAINMLISIVMFHYVRTHPESLFENTMQFLGTVNLALAVGSILPIRGLDGGSIFENAILMFGGNQNFASHFVTGTGILVSIVVVIVVLATICRRLQKTFN